MTSPKAEHSYTQIWRIVDGALRNALAAHPDMFNPAKPQTNIRASIVKRITGALHGHAVERRRGADPG